VADPLSDLGREKPEPLGQPQPVTRPQQQGQPGEGQGGDGEGSEKDVIEK
ncbi:MAG: hypothetical protein HYZ72_13465, partial [Deltaproteobacteria bacterium]|nr:hypothetical protein [Deltaproteobacteria bacterium]